MFNFILNLPDLILVLLGFILLISGGESVVQGAITLARKINVSPLLIGFTIVAVGTSLPELAVTIKAVSSNSEELVDLAVGGVLGSNVANIMLVLGTAAMLGACDEPGLGIKKDAIAVMVASAILLITVIQGKISGLIGTLMLLSLIFYYIYSYNYSKKLGLEEEIDETWIGENMILAIIITVIGGIMIFLGAEFLIEGATGIANSMGISETIVGLTVTYYLAIEKVPVLLSIFPTFFQYVLITSGLIAAMLLGERRIGKRMGATMVAGYLFYMILLYTI